MLTKRPFLTCAALCVGATLITTGCFEEVGPTGADVGPAGVLFVVESDFQSGVLESIDLETNTLTALDLPIYSDAVVRTYNGAVYILERFGADNVLKFDPSATDESGVVYQQHLGDGWNPVGIEFVSATKAYIANHNAAHISVFDPTAHTITGSIDISDYTFKPDSNTSPYANEMVLVGDRLYVMLQRRNGFNPGAPTLILTIDTETDANLAADSIRCQYQNGYDMVYVDGALYVTNPGNGFVVGDGAIEKVDLATGAVSTVIDENTLGGNPNQIVHKSGTHFYVQNYIGWQNVSVVEVDAAAGTVVETLPGVKDAFGGLCYDAASAKLYVGERDSSAIGVHVYENNVHVAGPIMSENSLPPSGMAIVR